MTTVAKSKPAPKSAPVPKKESPTKDKSAPAISPKNTQQKSEVPPKNATVVAQPPLTVFIAFCAGVGYILTASSPNFARDRVRGIRGIEGKVKLIAINQSIEQVWGLLPIDAVNTFEIDRISSTEA